MHVGALNVGNPLILGLYIFSEIFHVFLSHSSSIKVNGHRSVYVCVCVSMCVCEEGCVWAWVHACMHIPDRVITGFGPFVGFSTLWKSELLYINKYSWNEQGSAFCNSTNIRNTTLKSYKFVRYTTRTFHVYLYHKKLSQIFFNTQATKIHYKSTGWGVFRTEFQFSKMPVSQFPNFMRTCVKISDMNSHEHFFNYQATKIHYKGPGRGVPRIEF